MRKKIFIGIVFLAIAAIAAFNVNLNTNTNSEQSLLSLANVEALAQENNQNQPSYDKWTQMSFPCLNSSGNPTGRTYYACFKPGYLENCTSTSC
jgi:uncharacterized protein YxeA